MLCSICSRCPACTGVLCEECRDELIGPVSITPEQIHTLGEPSSTAALIDIWGGVHRLAHDTVLGRTTEPPALLIFDSAVSRRHARLWQTDDGWLIHDAGSRNRTYVDGAIADRPIPVRDKQQVRLGYIAFYFLGDASGIVSPTPSTLTGMTARAAYPGKSRDITKTRAIELPPHDGGLPPVVLELHQPTGGGAGIVGIDGKLLVLTLPQYELIVRLADRMTERASDDAHIRGFLTVGELARLLSLDTSRPDEDNIRQLVRRVRGACTRAGIRDLIESRYSLGYRLTVTPKRP